MSDWTGVNTKVFFCIFGFDFGSEEFGVQKSFGIGASQEIGGFTVSVSDFRIVDRKALAFWLRRHFIKRPQCMGFCIISYHLHLYCAFHALNIVTISHRLVFGKMQGLTMYDFHLFTLFTLLPLELRLVIWDLALPSSRVKAYKIR